MNELVLKMDGVEVGYLYIIIRVRCRFWWVGGCGVCDVVFGVSWGEMCFSVDFGDSSKYLNENFEDWSGERFDVNSIWMLVSCF